MSWVRAGYELQLNWVTSCSAAECTKGVCTNRVTSCSVNWLRVVAQLGAGAGAGTDRQVITMVVGAEASWGNVKMGLGRR